MMIKQSNIYDYYKGRSIRFCELVDIVPDRKWEALLLLYTELKEIANQSLLH